jgi:hypothetical protein
MSSVVMPASTCGRIQPRHSDATRPARRIASRLLSFLSCTAPRVAEKRIRET